MEAPSPFVIPSVAEGSAVPPSALPIFPSKPQPSNRRVIPTEVEGPAVPSIPITNVEWKRPSPLCHPERSRVICSSPLGPPFFHPNPNPQTDVSSRPKWRDLLFHRFQ